MKKISLIVLLVFTTISFSQSKREFWNTSSSKSQSTILENKHQIINPKLFELDFNALKNQLSNSPNRFGGKSKSNITLGIPNENGQIEHFTIYESSNMDPELAAKYPEIKSYLGQGIENPYAKIYFSISPLGFQSMKLNADQSAVFIEPYTTDLSTYVVYKKSDKINSLSHFECQVIDEAQQIVATSMTARPNADDGVLRTFRLALSVTSEYTTYFGGTKALALAAINNTMTRINGVFEVDFSVHMNLIANNDLIIYTNASTDPYSSASTGAGGVWGTELQNNLTATIGENNYDVGHLFGATGGGGNAGCIGCVCTNGSKGKGYSSPANGIPSGDNFDIDYVAHELGHQFGANHTFTHSTETGTGAQMEPGSGSTIMGYAGITLFDVQPHSDAYFHAYSIQQVTNNIKTKTCQTNTPTGNAIPTANAGLDYTIPKSTPFMLTGSGTDTNNDVLSYCWEQMNLGTSATTTPNATKTSGPNFRSYNPTASPVRIFPKMSSILAGTLVTSGSSLTQEALPSVARTLNFRLTVRDNRIIGPGNNSDDTVITVSETAGPFTVDSPNTAVSYIGNTNQTITWTVAGTNANGVNCANVDVLLSTDSGLTFPITLAYATPNDGSETLIIPNLVGTTNRIMIKGNNNIFFDVSNTNFTITNGTPDTTPPSSPTITASATTPMSTVLSWSGATDNLGVSTYNIYQNGILIGNTAASTFNVTGLTPSTSYVFTVVALDFSSNSSVPSNSLSVTTSEPDTIPPTTPILTANQASSTSVNLTWSTSTDNYGIASYNIYQNSILIATASTTSFLVSSLIPSTTYSYTVNSVDIFGNVSALSNTATFTTPYNYCASSASSTANEQIGNVTLGNINNTSTGGLGYTDFTAISTNLTLGSSNTISITPTWSSTARSEGYSVFIDYNRDGDFGDVGETVWAKTTSTSTPVAGTFTVPLTANPGQTRMRVSMKYNGTPTACEAFSFGQVEDYTVVIVAPQIDVNLNLKMFLSGYYNKATHQMQSVRMNQGLSSNANEVDTINVELRSATSPTTIIATTSAMLLTNGNSVCTFTNPPSGSYYLVVKYRNAIQTWSANTIAVGTTAISYDFTNVANKAYGNNMDEVEPGIFSFYSGDINHDGNIDTIDFPFIEVDASNFASGVYDTDLNGDGNVDTIDFPIWEVNASKFISTITP